MKLNKYISLLSVLLLGFIGCSDNHDKVFYKPEQVAANKMGPVKESYFLNKDDESKVVDTFRWGELDFGYQAAITYVLQIDLKGKDFANPQEVTSTSKREADVTVQALNNSMLALQKSYKFVHATPQDVEFRVLGRISEVAEGVFSDALSSRVTPYFAFPKVWVIGDYCDWDHGSTQFLYGYDENNTNRFEAWIGFGDKAANGFKITDSAGWSGGNWGVKEGQSIEAEANEIPLWNDGGSSNIEVYSKKFYRLAFDKASSTFYNLASMDSFAVLGSAVAEETPMDFDEKQQQFTVTLNLSKGDIRFRADQKEGDLSFGKGSNEGKLAVGNTPIAVEAGMYTVVVNINNPADYSYSIEQTDPINPELITPPSLEDEFAEWTLRMSDRKTITWLPLDFGDQREAAVDYQLELDLKGNDFTNAVLLSSTKGLSFEFEAKDLLEKIKQLSPEASLDNPINLSWRVTATVAGLTVKLSSEVKENTVIITDDPEFPETLYMIGQQFGDWNWDDAGIVSMIPVHSQEGSFWAIKYLEKGAEFKWAPKKEWGKDFASLNEVIGYSVESGNAVIAESDLYMIYIDISADRIAIEPAQVFGMGDVFGGWDEKKFAFTIEDKKMVYEPTLASSELRLYAYSQYAREVGWWQMEFVLRNGVIEYRGTGDDQTPRVAVEAEKRIELEFHTNSGAIK